MITRRTNAMYLSLFLSFFVIVCNLTFCAGNGALPSSLTSPCKINDIKCFENGFKTIILQVVSGIPDLGIKSSDPQFLELIEGKNSGLKYTLYNSTISGYAKCKFINLKLREDFSHTHSEVNCPHLSISGDYEISGQLMSIPVEEKGHFNAESEYNLTSEYNAEIIKSSDTKSNLHVKDFKVKSEPLNIRINFGNLFNGQTDLADAVHKFAQEKRCDITKLLEDAVWNASFQKIVDNFNKFLEFFALDGTLSS